MPPRSQAQRGWAFANKDKGGKLGAAAKEFAESDPGGKLPARVKPTGSDRRKALYPKSK